MSCQDEVKGATKVGVFIYNCPWAKCLMCACVSEREGVGVCVYSVLPDQQEEAELVCRFQANQFVTQSGELAYIKQTGPF